MEAAALATRVAALEAELAQARSVASIPVPDLPQAPGGDSQNSAPGVQGDAATGPRGDRGATAAEEVWRGKVERLQAERDAARSRSEQVETRLKQLEEVLAVEKQQHEEQLKEKLAEQRQREDRLQRELTEVRAGEPAVTLGLPRGTLRMHVAPTVHACMRIYACSGLGREGKWSAFCCRLLTALSHVWEGKVVVGDVSGYRR